MGKDNNADEELLNMSNFKTNRVVENSEDPFPFERNTRPERPPTAGAHKEKEEK